ncbi:MAG TPA: FAD binding domain-containing protein, partial [Gemmataceae bacterium]|nr:FAD binding domain-containing protein [Gemmataceae bacterium]
FVLMYVNGRRFSLRGETVFSTLSDFLRHELQLVGTKVVCAEGDCGACTVLVGRLDGNKLRYDTVDSCIQFLYQLDGKHVVTVEGLKRNECLHPVQQALVDCHGSQCGFCTPGFVMALTGLFEEKKQISLNEMRLSLTGNLCRCTGYVQILEAGDSLNGPAWKGMAELYPSREIIEDLRQHSRDPVLVGAEMAGSGPGSKPRIVFIPRRLEEALEFKASHPEAVIVSGATEVGVWHNKKAIVPSTILNLRDIPGLDEINSTDHTLAIGANATWTQIEAFAKTGLPEFFPIIIRFGSPQIRNVATMAANVANGSPIADALPFLSITNAEVEMAGKNGRRRVNINQFYPGYKSTDLRQDEIITNIFIPLPAPDELLKLYKVSKRNDLDIATFGAGIRIKKSGDIITRAFVAYGGVAPTVIRLPNTETFLQGKRFAEETFTRAGEVARLEINPIADVRGSRDFRLQLAENILLKFYFDCCP